MATAAELGISEQEYQDAIYLEKMYQVVSACKDSCTRCGSSPIAFYKTDTVDLLCRNCGARKPHSRRLGDAHFRKHEVEKFQKKYGTTRPRQASAASAIPPPPPGRSSKHRSRRKKTPPSSSSSSSDVPDQSTASSGSSIGEKRRRKKQNRQMKQNAKHQVEDIGWGTFDEPFHLNASATVPPAPVPGMLGVLQQQRTTQALTRSQGGWDFAHAYNPAMQGHAAAATPDGTQQSLSYSLPRQRQMPDQQPTYANVQRGPPASQQMRQQPHSTQSLDPRQSTRGFPQPQQRQQPPHPQQAQRPPQSHGQFSAEGLRYSGASLPFADPMTTSMVGGQLYAGRGRAMATYSAAMGRARGMPSRAWTSYGLQQSLDESYFANRRTDMANPFGAAPVYASTNPFSGRSSQPRQSVPRYANPFGSINSFTSAGGASSYEQVPQRECGPQQRATYSWWT